MGTGDDPFSTDHGSLISHDAACGCGEVCFGPRFVFREGDFLKCGGHLGDLGELGDVVNNWGVADAA